MVKFELTDDNLLRLNGTALSVHGAWSFADPSSYHDAFYGEGVARSATKDRWHGLAVLGFAAQNFAVAESNGLGARDAKKNALLASGAVWGAAALFHGYNISSGATIKDAKTVGNLVALAGMSALNIWKGAGGKDKKAKATVK